MKEILGLKRRVGIFVPRQIKNGNTGQTRHWSQSHKERKAWVQAVALATCVEYDEHGNLTPIELPSLSEPIGLQVHRVFTGRQRAMDPDSILRGNVKQAIDSLVEAGLVEDDNAKCIQWVIGTQEKADGEPYSAFYLYY